MSNAIQVSGAFDYSHAIAAFEMIKYSVAEYSTVLTDIVSSVKAVEEVLSLKSGAGLVEIWRALSSCVPEVNKQLDELEASDRRVPFARNDSSKFHHTLSSSTVLMNIPSQSYAIKYSI